jgi:pyruvate dehydrogenase E1 component
MYAGGQSILIGTPAGVTLAPEGGAHQSIITPSVGLEQPRCVAWEPAFGQDLEWVLLAAMAGLAREDGHSSYLRLSTRPVDQGLAEVPAAGPGREARRRAVLGGGYRLREADGGARPRVTLVGMGVVMPEVLSAAQELAADGIPTAVVCLTSADLVFRALQARRGLNDRGGGGGGGGSDAVLAELFPASSASPLVTVLDGHPHTLSFLGAVNDSPISCLGVQDFGQSGDVEDLYRHFGIDAETIVGAALDLI